VLVLCFQGAAKEPQSNAKDSSGAGCKYSTVLLPNEFLKMCKLSQISSNAGESQNGGKGHNHLFCSRGTG
jgi:hypothetical protein